MRASREWCLQKNKSTNLRCAGHFTELWALVAETFNLVSKKEKRRYPNTSFISRPSLKMEHYSGSLPHLKWANSVAYNWVFTLPTPNQNSPREKKKGAKVTRLLGLNSGTYSVQQECQTQRLTQAKQMRHVAHGPRVWHAWCTGSMNHRNNVSVRFEAGPPGGWKHQHIPLPSIPQLCELHGYEHRSETIPHSSQPSQIMGWVLQEVGYWCISQMRVSWEILVQFNHHRGDLYKIHWQWTNQ